MFRTIVVVPICAGGYLIESIKVLAMSSRYSLSENPLALMLAVAVALGGCADNILTDTGESVIRTDLTCTTDGTELSAKFLSRGKTQEMCAVLDRP